MKNKPFILASASPRRQELLKQMGLIPKNIIAANIDETPCKKETPKNLAKRLAKLKAQEIAKNNQNTFIIAADTVVSCGQRVLPKAENEQQAHTCLTLLSGRRHRVYGGLCVITDTGKIHTRLSETIVKFKNLSDDEIQFYLQSKEWQGKAGGYAIQGIGAQYIAEIHGSYTNVVGLCLYNTMQILKGHDFFQK